MLLMDSIAQAAAAVAAVPPNPILAIFPDLSRRMQGAPRFLLDEAATRTAVELTLGRPRVLREALEHLLIPYPRLWVEWPEPAREALRRQFRIDAVEKPGRPLPTRIGFLLEGEDGRDWSQRRGRVTWAWISPGIPIPNIGPIEARFDLDRVFDISGNGLFEALGHRTLCGDISAITNNLWDLWRDNPPQYAALQSIWKTAEHRPSAWGSRVLDGENAYAVAGALADVFGEYITVWACLMLLTASRPIVRCAAVDPARLNKRRRQRGEAPLLAHTMVSLHLDRRDVRPVVKSPLGYVRKSPRVHLVSSYLARRGAKHWIVRPYMRGQGEVVNRHVAVKGAAS